MIPIIVTVWDRVRYFEKMVESFRHTRWPDGEECRVYVWDDGSTRPEVPRLTSMLNPYRVLSPGRVGMMANYTRAMEHAQSLSVPFFVTVDSDAVVHPDWLCQILALYRDLRSKSITVAQCSAFTWYGYGPEIDCGHYRRLRTSGAVCCLFNCDFLREHKILETTKANYNEAVRLRAEGRKGALVACEHYISKAAAATGALIVATKPSYAQHIGTEVHSSKNAPKAVATDFVGEGR